MNSPEMGRRLQMARTELGMTQIELARRAGVSQSTIANIESGRNAGSKHILQIAVAMGINPRWLSEGAVPRYLTGLMETQVAKDPTVYAAPNSADLLWIDRYTYSLDRRTGHVQWTAVEAQAALFRKRFFDSTGASAENCRLFGVGGDDMEPFVFQQDVILIDTARTTAREGKIFLVDFEGEPLIKQVFKEPGGVLRLHAYNPQYPDKIIGPEHEGSVRIVGECIYRAGAVL